MSGEPVAIASVRIDQPSRITPGRIRYRVTLACGCSWGEDHDASAPAPARGTMATCFAGHSAKPERLLHSTRSESRIPPQVAVGVAAQE
jgi:hypothetical protein